MCINCYYDKHYKKCEACNGKAKGDSVFSEKRINRKIAEDKKILEELAFNCFNECGNRVWFFKLYDHLFNECPKFQYLLLPREITQINKKYVINKDYLSQIKGEEECMLCHNILLRPYCCSKCYTNFCFNCIFPYKKRKAKCPKCNQNLILIKSISAENVLKKLKFKCENNCETEILYDDLESHYASKCSYFEKPDNSKIIKKYLRYFFIALATFLFIVCYIYLNHLFLKSEFVQKHVRERRNK